MSSESQQSYAEYVRDTYRRQLGYKEEDFVESAVRDANQALVRDDYAEVAAIASTLADVLLETATQAEFRSYAAHVDDVEAAFYPAPLSQFLEDEDRLVERAMSDGGSEFDRRERQRIQQAFESLTCIAQIEDHVRTAVQGQTDVVGFSKKIGEHLQDAEMDLGDPVRGVSEQAGALKTLFTGGTGMGKSCGLETEAEDYYQRNFEEGRNFKLIDLIDLRDGDTWFYDIPQQQDVLKRVRHEKGLPETFADSDAYGDPDVEVLAPLTPGLTDEDLPFDTETEEFTVRPFTVPASELRKPLLVSLIMSRLSESEEQTVREAYDDVERQSNDWSLSDLADQIREKDELSPKHKKKAISVIRTLQDEGYIRTKESNFTIDWRGIFDSPETITVFTQAFCKTEIGRLMSFAYLIDAITKSRERMYGVPECVLLMRELWKVVPHNRRQHYDDRVAAVQEAIGYIMSTIFRENRHSGIHLLGDTQQPSDLLKPVREMFNRYVVYSANKDTLDDIMSWTQNDKLHSFWSTMTSTRGQAGIIGQVQPAIDERDIEFLSPVEYAAPSHHHAQAGVDANGWRGRVKYLEHEELRQPADVEGVRWPDEIPDSLNVEAADRDQGPDIDMSPVAAFADECVTHEEWEEIQKDELRATFNEYLKANNKEPWDFASQKKGNTERFGSRFGDYFTNRLDKEIESRERTEGYAYIHVKLTPAGRTFYDHAHGPEEQPAGAPMRESSD